MQIYSIDVISLFSFQIIYDIKQWPVKLIDYLKSIESQNSLTKYAIKNTILLSFDSSARGLIIIKPWVIYHNW